MFLQVCVCPQGGVLPQCMLGDPPTRENPTCQVDPSPPGSSGDHRRPGDHPPSQGDPPARETPPLPGRPPLQAHTQGGNWGGSGPGPHARGKLRGIRSRPTPKGEIEGDHLYIIRYITRMHSSRMRTGCS